jgi:hypothetical protein
LCDDDVTYERMRVVDFDDDRVVPPPSPCTIEIRKRLFPGCDPLVSHFRDLRESHRAIAGGGALEDAILRPESSTIIQKGHVFKDIEALKIWFREYVVVHNWSYRVKNSHAARRYTITCESSHCQWKVCGRKMKGSINFKINREVGPHTCGSAEPNQKHSQLTSKFIANHLLPVVKQDPAISIRGVIGIVTLKWNYTVKYGKACTTHRRALRMIYGSWEHAYEGFPIMLNAMKVANPGMHYE